MVAQEGRKCARGCSNQALVNPAREEVWERSTKSSLWEVVFRENSPKVCEGCSKMSPAEFAQLSELSEFVELSSRNGGSTAAPNPPSYDYACALGALWVPWAQCVQRRQMLRKYRISCFSQFPEDLCFSLCQFLFCKINRNLYKTHGSGQFF